MAKTKSDTTKFKQGGRGTEFSFTAAKLSVNSYNHFGKMFDSLF